VRHLSRHPVEILQVEKYELDHLTVEKAVY
jgi:hypothetical protein